MSWSKGDRLRNLHTNDKGTISQINKESVYIRHRDAPGISVGTQEALERMGWELAED